MSVIVKTMDMPESCVECRFLAYDDYSTGCEYECTALKEFMNEDDLPMRRRKDCPLIQVKQGHWVKQWETKHARMLMCSECKVVFNVGTGREGNYCPECGAIMNVETE